jgi:PAS domain S-box-containing protein
MNPASAPYQPETSIVAFKSDKHMHDALMHNLEGMLYCCLYDKDWTMVFVSNGCKELTGYDPDDLLQNKHISYEAVTLEDDRIMVRDTINNALNEGTRYEVEYRIKHANGSVIWVLERGNPIYNDAGAVIALEGYIQNIAKRKHRTITSRSRTEIPFNLRKHP